VSFTKETLKNQRIAVLYGGLSSERDVSLRTGEACTQALRGLGYDVLALDVGRDLAQRLLAEKIEVAFIALHGRWGEDGCIQGLLEAMFIPYTGSGVLASAAGMDKAFAKQVFTHHGVPTPPFQLFSTVEEALAGRDLLPFGLPCVVKPSREGSSVGVHLCKTPAEYEAGVKEAATHAGMLLVEQYIKGREVQGAVLDNRSLGVIEIIPANEFYDYQAKYQSAGKTKYLFPAPLPPAQDEQVKAVCLAAHRALGCSGATRSDVIVAEDGRVFLLEVNTLPGMTEASLLPKIAAGTGLDFASLCEQLLLGASLKA